MAGGGQVINLLGKFSHAIAVTGFICGLSLTVTVISTEGAAAQVFKVIHTFNGPPYDGEHPEAGLTQAGGTLYGTTFGSLGGAPSKTCSKGCGNEYAVVGGQITKTYFFKARQDGAFPTGEVVVNNGTVFGTTEFGGQTACGGLGCGVAFLLTSTGSEKHVSFCNGFDFPVCPDGALPRAGPIIGNDRNLYGTTSLGGAENGYECDNNFGGCGTVYMLTRDLKTETVLYSFCSVPPQCQDGAVPLGKLLQDASGNFYGTTQFGGMYGEGTIFKLQPSGGTYTESVLYSFCLNNLTDCPDGAIPEAGLIKDRAGNLYGTASAGGGTDFCQGSTPGCGVVFKLAPDGTYSRLYAFAGGADGALPLAPLVKHNGNLYGTTEQGGGGGYCLNPNIGCGTVFMLAADGTEMPIHIFGENKTDGLQPEGALLLYKGYFYGVTRVGGVSPSHCHCGTLFKIRVANTPLTASRQAHGRPPGLASRPVQTKSHPAS